MPLVLVMIGGALGTAARYLTGRAALAAFGPAFPFGTLAVNVIGGLLMGVLAGLLARAGNGGEAWRLFVGVGVLGGFTTFSAFSLDVVTMVERGAPTTAIGYILLSLIGGIGAVFAGLMLVRGLFGSITA